MIPSTLAWTRAQVYNLLRDDQDGDGGRQGNDDGDGGSELTT